MDVTLFYELQQYKRFAVSYLNRFLMTPEDKIEECFPGKMIQQKIESLARQQLCHIPMILPMIQWQVGATPLAIHSYNVSSIALLIGHTIGMEEDDIIELFTAAMLHDVGKMFISNSILDKPDKLAVAERYAMQQHPRIGAIFLQTHYPELSEDIIDAVFKHHELPNGTGYYGFKGDEVGAYARIISAADIFSAAVEERTYHPARSLNDGYHILSTISSIDTEYIDAIKRNIDEETVFEPNIIY